MLFRSALKPVVYEACKLQLRQMSQRGRATIDMEMPEKNKMNMPKGMLRLAVQYGVTKKVMKTSQTYTRQK